MRESRSRRGEEGGIMELGRLLRGNERYIMLTHCCLLLSAHSQSETPGHPGRKSRRTSHTAVGTQVPLFNLKVIMHHFLRNSDGTSVCIAGAYP